MTGSDTTTDLTDLDSVRSEYGTLLGMSRRTDAQKARYAHLSGLLERWPQPFFTNEEQIKHREAAERFDEAVLGMSDAERARLMAYVA